MALTLADPASQTTMQTLLISTATVTATAVPTGGATAPITGDQNNGAPSAPATVIIVVGVVLGLVGVGSVITLIWWMRRRALARYRLNEELPPPPVGSNYPPAPPPKGGYASKYPPHINVASANAYRQNPPTRAARSGSGDSLNKDKALPIKPVESVWTSPTERTHKSPALTSMHELKNSPKQKPEEVAMQRMRSDSVGSYQQPTAPTNFI